MEATAVTEEEDSAASGDGASRFASSSIRSSSRSRFITD